MKIKLDENPPTRLADFLSSRGHDVHTVPDENLSGRPDAGIWRAASAENRFPITQDLDFSDRRRFAPGTHAGLMLLRLREPSANALMTAVSGIVDELDDWQGCFVVMTEETELRGQAAPA